MDINKPLNYLWAIDGINFDSSFCFKAAKYLTSEWANKTLGTIHPTTILPKYNLNLEESLKKVKSNLLTLDSSHGSTNILTARIIQSDAEKPAVHDLVKELCGGIDSCDVDVVVIRRTNKNLLSKVITGSFAECLLDVCKRPTIILGNNLPKVERVLFATDFSPASFMALKEITKLAKRLKAKIFIFHQIEWRTYHVHSGNINAVTNSKEIKKWKNYCTKLNVNFEFHFNDDNMSPKKAIIDHANKVNADVISMVSSTARVRNKLLGSTTQFVLRNSIPPTFIFHPKPI